VVPGVRARDQAEQRRNRSAAEDRKLVSRVFNMAE